MPTVNRNELYTPTELNALLGMPRASLFAKRRKYIHRLDRPYGLVQAFSRDELPGEWVEKLDALLVASGCASARELLLLRRNKTSNPGFVLEKKTPAAQRRIAITKPILCRYFSEMDNGLNEGDANSNARLIWRLFFGQEPNEITIRRIAKNVLQFGGPDIAPAEAYTDRRSGAKHTAKSARKTPQAPEDHVQVD